MTTDSIKKTPSKETLWRQRILGWQKSGGSQKDFCVRHGLKLATFQYWRRKLKTEPPSGSRLRLVPIQDHEALPSSITAPQTLRITVADVVFDITSDLDPGTLAGFVAALRG